LETTCVAGYSRVPLPPARMIPFMSWKKGQMIFLKRVR
jgi:hypothetical protein